MPRFITGVETRSLRYFIKRASQCYYVKKLVVDELDKAYLNIETDYSQSDKGQLSTRLAAFLETIDR